jgi:hypothetical protein
MLSSGPHAWLYTLFARLSKDRTFRLLSPSHQFELLRGAVALEHPAKAAAMNEWSPATRDGLLLHLANTVRQESAVETMELWRVRKGERELSCVTRYLPTGIDVRLLEGDDFRRTQLCRDAPAVEALASRWKSKLLEAGRSTE